MLVVLDGSSALASCAFLWKALFVEGKVLNGRKYYNFKVQAILEKIVRQFSAYNSRANYKIRANLWGVAFTQQQ
jgi:hypothetical protein